MTNNLLVLIHILDLVFIIVPKCVGAGYVEMVDIRTPNKIINNAWCHQGSICTVQCHPLKTHHFLTSSKTG